MTSAQDVPRLRIMFSRGQEEKNSKEMSTNGKNKENKGIILSTKVDSQQLMTAAKKEKIISEEWNPDIVIIGI